MFSAPLWWCARCGAHTRRRVRDLALPCNGPPTYPQADLRRRRLWSGVHPVDGTQLQDGGRVTVQQWFDLLAQMS